MIDIIIPSFNDLRIIRTISSIRVNKSYNLTKLIIIDGGSNESLLRLIRPLLRDTDFLISENDNGIFDALNKGLNSSKSEFIYWLGSDDFINVNYDFDNAIAIFKKDSGIHGICYKTLFFNDFNITRSLFIKNASLNRYKLGFHLPHFSTIWRRSSIGDLRFDLEYRISSDYDFFFKLFKSNSVNVKCINQVMVFMQEGGNSTKGLKQRWKGLKDVSKIHYKNTSSIPLTILAIFNRYFYKTLNLFNKSNTKKSSIVRQLSDILIETKIFNEKSINYNNKL